MNNNIQPYYFRGRGRAESIRILLNYLKLPCEDVFIDTPEAMETLRIQKLSPFKQIPILHIDNHYLVQTPAILRYLARKYNLYGNNDLEKYRCDMLAGAASDWQANYFKAVFNASFAKDYENGILQKHLTIFENFLQGNAADFFVNEIPTFTDLLIFELLLNHIDMFTDCLQAYSALRRFTEKLMAISQLKSYFDSDKRQPFPSIETGYVQTVHRVLGRN